MMIPIKDIKKSNRINKLKFPKKWTNVLVSRDPTSHIQAVARDTSGKKQYIYHPKFVELTTQEKFKRIQKFSPLLKKFITGVYSKIKNLTNIETKEEEICLLFYILNKTWFRIGNDTYNTYGLTTLEKKHITFQLKDTIIFDFIGKKKMRNYKKIRDSVIYILLKNMCSNKKQNEAIFKVTSNEMNDYLQKNMSPEFTCKDFRTYYGNILFIKCLCSGLSTRESYNKVAEALCHTKYISKKSYIMSSKIEELYKQKRYLFEGTSPEKILVSIQL
jgi:DNA topoisomerase-1